MARRLVGYRRLTVSASVVTLEDAVDPISSDTGVPEGASEILIKVVGADVRVATGEDPTAANGFPLIAGDKLEEFDVASAADLRFIRSGASDATLEILFAV